MVGVTDSRGRTPVGVVLLSLFLGLYGLLWLATWALADAAGNRVVAWLSAVVGVGVLSLAYFLYRGSPTAWWVTVALLGVSTLWRLSLAVNGASANLPNALVGAVLLAYLLGTYEFYRPARPG